MITWAVVSDIDTDWKKTKKEAKARALEFKKQGAKYCFVEKFDNEGSAGKPEYIYSEALGYIF